MNVMEDLIILRLKNLLKELDLNQTEFAKAISISPGNISDIMTGRSKPSLVTLKKIAEKFNVNLNWLLTGEGEMFITSNLPIEIKDAEIYIQKGKQLINITNTNQVVEIDYVELFEQRVSAGPGQDLLDQHQSRFIPILHEIIHPYKANEIGAVIVRGDSMTKISLFDGDIVFFVKANQLIGEGVYVYTIDNEVYVKRLAYDPIEKTLTIYSENDRYPPKTIKADFDRIKIEGRVIAWIHKHPY